jgi:hypothetical protein
MIKALIAQSGPSKDYFGLGIAVGCDPNAWFVVFWHLSLQPLH